MHYVTCSDEKSEMGSCCVPHGRHFVSRKEKKEMLEKYKEQLEKELEGVNERITELSKTDK